MLGRKWNVQKKIYEEFELPEKAKIFSSNMDEEVQCAECGKDIFYGDAYTSRVIHGIAGMGYGVCNTCYEKERMAEAKLRKLNSN